MDGAVEQSRQGRNTGPLGSGLHVVQEGDCFLSVAYEHGFFWKTLWDLPANAELRDGRQDPGQLLPGDRVTIPERRTKEVPANTEARHRFVMRGVPARLRLVVEYEDAPVSNTAYVLTLDGSARSGKTDERGLLVVSIPPDASQGVLEINGLRFALQLGALDPASENVGIQRRLANLGFYRGELDGVIGPQTREAVSTFQARTGLPATGQLDDTTREKLVHRHDETHERLAAEAGSGPPPPPTEGRNG